MSPIPTPSSVPTSPRAYPVPPPRPRPRSHVVPAASPFLSRSTSSPSLSSDKSSPKTTHNERRGIARLLHVKFPRPMLALDDPEPEPEPRPQQRLCPPARSVRLCSSTDSIGTLGRMQHAVSKSRALRQNYIRLETVTEPPDTPNSAEHESPPPSIPGSRSLSDLVNLCPPSPSPSPSPGEPLIPNPVLTQALLADTFVPDINLPLTPSPSPPPADPVALRELLSHHTLPVSTCIGPQVPLNGAPASPCVLRFNDTLLRRLSNTVASYSGILAPQQRGCDTSAPGAEDTERFAAQFSHLSQRVQIAANARSLSDGTIDGVAFMVKHLLRPLNELLGCMLLPFGVQAVWRLTDDCPNAQAEFVVLHPQRERLAVMSIHCPTDLSDGDIDNFFKHLRRGKVQVNNSGDLVVSNSLNLLKRPVRHHSHPCYAMCKIVAGLLATGTPLAVFTNCNHFMTIQATDPSEPAAEFSKVVHASASPTDNLCKSPLGLLLGVSMFALEERGISFNDSGSVSSMAICSNLLIERFGTNDASNDLDIRLKRRAIVGAGVYPSQLGPSSFTFTRTSNIHRFPGEQSFSAGPPVGTPFYGPFNPNTMPNNVANTLPTLPRLLAGTQPDSWWTPQLELVEFRGCGELWEIFCARFAWLPTSTPDVIAKFVDIESVPDTSTPSLEPHTAMRVCKEIRLYLGPLASLQGTVVPRFLGLLGSCQHPGWERWCALVEDAGMPLQPSDIHDSLIRFNVRRRYEMLHDAGVLHNDVAYRHIVQRNGHVRLIDFDRAIVRDKHTDDVWDTLCQMEMANVSKVLGECW